VAQNLGVGLRLGNHVGLGAFNFIGAQGGVSIGDNVICGPRVSFHAENHVYADPDTPIRLQGVTRQGIVVENDCWIGAGAMILDGVHIGRGSVVAAGAVVTRDVPPYSVVAGVPARVIKSRRAEEPATPGAAPGYETARPQ
jgi:acetyltransferase-like isoleucine patch superfamily enzyme